MNKYAIMIIGVLMSGLAVSAMAGKGSGPQLSECRAEIAATFGDQARTRLQGMKRGGKQLNLRVTHAADEAFLAVCTLNAQGFVELRDKDGLVLTAPQAQAPEQLTRAK